MAPRCDHDSAPPWKGSVLLLSFLVLGFCLQINTKAASPVYVISVIFFPFSSLLRDFSPLDLELEQSFLPSLDLLHNQKYSEGFPFHMFCISCSSSKSEFIRRSISEISK